MRSIYRTPIKTPNKKKWKKFFEFNKRLIEKIREDKNKLSVRKARCHWKIIGLINNTETINRDSPFSKIFEITLYKKINDKRKIEIWKKINNL